ncbi:MazG-like family protein [Xenorhabdus sp. XENO-10]|uniref:MazG-like family protein n=1 Tax=Xenorhabdus yunnanensis TaxID=3025878 RepID=A0ABT5LFA8_9GAMM|nr:MazG-like family protein [Xenorhabdus yunnanensis]MDC9588569.1 MazG-like family protein [Xenorhabdus yunnanensis]
MTVYNYDLVLETEELVQPCDELDLLKYLHRARRPLPYEKHIGTHAMTDVISEMNRQDGKWGANRNLSPFVWQTILSEEVGEFAQAILHDEYGGSHAGTARAEMVQVAAVALQIIEMYDRLEQVKQKEPKCDCIGKRVRNFFKA